MLKKTVALGLGVALSTAALPTLADTHISFVDDKGEVTTQMFVKNGKVRVEGQNGAAISIYDSASNTATVLLPGQKKYLRLDSENTAQMGAESDAAQQKIQNAQAQAQAKLAQNQQEMDQANQQMETATANLTPEQKAMLQQMNQSHTGSNNPLPGAQDSGMQVVIKDLGTTETVAGHSCRDVQVVVNNQPRATDCVVDSPASLGIPSADLKTLQSMRAGMQKLMSHMGVMGQGMATASLGSGFAIKTTRQTYRNLSMQTETDTLKSISTGSVDAGLFTIPAGYTQTTFQEMIQGGHQ
jgi:hypothetical protein